MGSLKVILIVLLRDTFTVLITGSEETITGATVSVLVVKMRPAKASGFPARSNMLPVCNDRVYLVFAASSVVCVMVRVFPVMVLFMGVCVVPL